MKSLAGSSSLGKDYLNAFKEKQSENTSKGVLHFIVRITMDNYHYRLNFDLIKKNENYHHSYRKKEHHKISNTAKLVGKYCKVQKI